MILKSLISCYTDADINFGLLYPSILLVSDKLCSFEVNMPL